MARLTRWNPNQTTYWRDPFSIMDRMMGMAWDRDLPGWSNTQSWGLPLDVIEKDDAYVVRASIPGLNPDEIDVTLTDNVLTIHGETSHEDDEYQADRYVMRERQFGSFTRSVTLPMPVEADQIEATCSNGELKLILPKAEAVRPRRIAINRGTLGTAPGHVIEGNVQTGGKHWTAEDTNGGSKSRGWAEGQAEKPKSAVPETQGFAEGQTTTDRS